MRFESAEHAVSVVFNGVVASTWVGEISEAQASKVRAVGSDCGHTLSQRRSGVFYCSLCRKDIESFKVLMPRKAAFSGAGSPRSSTNDRILDAFAISALAGILEAQSMLHQSLLQHLYADTPDSHIYRKRVILGCAVKCLDQRGLKAAGTNEEALQVVCLVTALLDLARDQRCNRRKMDKRTAAKLVGIDENLMRPNRPWGRRFDVITNHFRDIEEEGLVPVRDYLAKHRLFAKESA